MGDNICKVYDFKKGKKIRSIDSYYHTDQLILDFGPGFSEGNEVSDCKIIYLSKAEEKGKNRPKTDSIGPVYTA